MPIYEYKCALGHVFELFESVVEHERYNKKNCPECGRKRRVEKLISKTGAPILKAGRCGGFYKPNA